MKVLWAVVAKVADKHVFFDYLGDAKRPRHCRGFFRLYGLADEHLGLALFFFFPLGQSPGTKRGIYWLISVSLCTRLGFSFRKMKRESGANPELSPKL
ncbi:hypothetical protein A3SI_02843 [Nitritalea halalkaliphila LW7]|uniref:Uncharacterized protein n=1 Tax=Nitritalea halalkaliphila LW7 TaxID=1189621 RepID=I5C9G1_9BACT|nr:hypothetical protein A3SI_02843 [Nitritalea halalkaliphila LW7]